MAHPTRFERVTFAFGGQLNWLDRLGVSLVQSLKGPENTGHHHNTLGGPPPKKGQVEGSRISVTVVTVPRPQLASAGWGMEEACKRQPI